MSALIRLEHALHLFLRKLMRLNDSRVEARKISKQAETNLHSDYTSTFNI
jgi:hypothetical protein